MVTQKELRLNDRSIIHGEVWSEPNKSGRPKARLFGFLSLVWLCVFLPAAGLLWTAWGEEGVPAWVMWACGMLLILEPVFVVATIVFWFIERPVNGKTSHGR